MTRAFWIAWVGILLGGGVLGASSWSLLRALRFRFKWGMPYIKGSITRALNSAVLGGLLLAAGASLAGVHWTLHGFTAVSETVEVCRMRVTEPGGGLLLEMRIGPAREDDAQPQIVTGLEGRRWAVTGTVVAFPGWFEPFGLATFHRLTGARDLDRDTAAPADRVSHLEALPSWLGIRVSRYVLPGRGPLPDWTGVALDPLRGYFLAFPGVAPVATEE